MESVLIEDIGRRRTDRKRTMGYSYPIVYYAFNIAL